MRKNKERLTEWFMDAMAEANGIGLIGEAYKAEIEQFRESAEIWAENVQNDVDLGIVKPRELDPEPYEFEGERFATNGFPNPGWGEYAWNPRPEYAQSHHLYIRREGEDGNL